MIEWVQAAPKFLRANFGKKYATNTAEKIIKSKRNFTSETHTLPSWFGSILLRGLSVQYWTLRGDFKNV